LGIGNLVVVFYNITLVSTFFNLPHVRSLVEYKAPIHFDEEIDVFVRISKIGRSSLSFEMGIYAKDDDHPRATGDVVWVHTDQESGRPSAVNTDLVALLRVREGEFLA